jgi:hypothetical protein
MTIIDAPNLYHGIISSLIARANAASKNISLPGNQELARKLLDAPWVPISFELSIGALKTLSHSITFECMDYVRYVLS